MNLTKPISVTSLPDDSDLDCFDYYNLDTGSIELQGRCWDLLGLHPGRPLLTRRHSDELGVDEERLTIAVSLLGKEI